MACLSGSQPCLVLRGRFGAVPQAGVESLLCAPVGNPGAVASQAFRGPQKDCTDSNVWLNRGRHALPAPDALVPIIIKGWYSSDTCLPSVGEMSQASLTNLWCLTCKWCFLGLCSAQPVPQSCLPVTPNDPKPQGESPKVCVLSVAWEVGPQGSGLFHFAALIPLLLFWGGRQLSAALVGWAVPSYSLGHCSLPG